MTGKLSIILLGLAFINYHPLPGSKHIVSLRNTRTLLSKEGKEMVIRQLNGSSIAMMASDRRMGQVKEFLCNVKLYTGNIIEKINISFHLVI